MPFEFYIPLTLTSQVCQVVGPEAVAEVVGPEAAVEVVGPEAVAEVVGPPPANLSLVHLLVLLLFADPENQSKSRVQCPREQSTKERSTASGPSHRGVPRQ